MQYKCTTLDQINDFSTISLKKIIFIQLIVLFNDQLLTQGCKIKKSQSKECVHSDLQKQDHISVSLEDFAEHYW